MKMQTPAMSGFTRLKKRVFRHAKPMIRKLWPLYTLGDWRPAHQLQPVPGRPGQFESIGADPHFRLAHPVPAGWYMFEAKLRLPNASVHARIYPDTGSGESEETAFSLRLHSERLCKRLVYLPADARLRFDPLSAPGSFGLDQLRLVRVGAAFARTRLRRKLTARHPLHATGAATATDEQLWTDYCKVFEVGSELVSYADWIERVEQPRLPSAADQLAESRQWQWTPLMSIVVPTYNTDPALLRACLDSVLAQGYPHWELCIADDASTQPEVRAILDAYARQDARVKLSYRRQNGHIVAASNSALALAGGEFVVLLDHDDELAPHALFEVVKALQTRPSAQIVYSDEDKLDPNGRRCAPYFKPDFSPDLLYSQNYISHLGVYRRELVQAVGAFRQGYEGSQDYDLVLRCIARITDARDIVHVPEVLYHWRMAEGSTASGQEQKSYTTDAARRALQNHFDSTRQPASVAVIAPGLYRQHWAIPEPAPLVSLIVPTRDCHDVLKTCVDSILQKTSYSNYEILIVDNQSTCPRTLAYMAELEAEGKARVLRYDQPFNYSAINNFAARHAGGSILGLINNDVEVISPDWLNEMASHAIRAEIGCVGAKLYYPNDTLQHGGVVCGIGGVAGHSHKYRPRDDDGYFSRLRIVHNTSAVTAAALLVRRDVFEQVGGLDETGLRVAFNDVDLCLKVMQAGYRNLWTPFAELYHHESISRGSDETPEKRERFKRECIVMQARWPEVLARDPYYNPNLTLRREDYSLDLAAEA
ncbi:glycosyltransferase family 2 protein [Massilia sp. Mn16-1_5]|uniref:glycosyltransferase family 2 protein n=1 Tax=Massilia sp. Mn16-1_5 TaxID=2079199 RepID=UPI001E3C2840|nr:glycosyltransferase family 2 protein [Massilia sp. Mn16-1_5]